MVAFCTGLSATEVDRHLRHALEELRQAEKSAVLWFAEVLERKLFKDLGFSSIHLYAKEALGFSTSKTFQFIRLCEAMRTLPAVKESVASGDLPWTKARELVKVATPRNEARWIERARTRSRRELEREVVAVKARAAARRKEGGQGLLLGGDRKNGNRSGGESGSGSGTGTGSGNGGIGGGIGIAGGESVEIEAAKAMPVEVTLRFSPEDFAEFEAMLEAYRKRGGIGTREEVVMSGVKELLTRESKGRQTETGACPNPRSGSGPASSTGSGPATHTGSGPATPTGSGPAPHTGSETAPHTDSPTGANGDKSRGGCRNCTRVHASPYQAVVFVCECCGKGKINTSRGLKAIEPAALKAILCDAKVYKRGEKNRSTVPPSVRLEVLARDGHRCQWRGCGKIHFVNVHHLVPREAGGSNRKDNLITLCAGCHRMIHVLAEKGLKPRGGEISPMVREPIGVWQHRAAWELTGELQPRGPVFRMVR